VRGLVGMLADSGAGGEGEVGMAAGWAFVVGLVAGLFVGAGVGAVAMALCAAGRWADAHLEVEDGGEAESVEQGGLGDAGVGGGGADRVGGVVEGVEGEF